MTRLLPLLLLTLAVNVIAQEERNSCKKGFHTLYSGRATSLDPAFERPVVLLSPDRKKKLSARAVEDSQAPDGWHLNYIVVTPNQRFQTKLLGFNGEIAWSPDSKAFVVTQTEGGGGIGSRVYVFYMDQSGLRKLDISSNIEKDFGTPVKCVPPDLPPNTAFVRWEADSSALLVAAEVIPVSICECMGTYRLYKIALPSLAILHVYSQTRAKKLFWRDLGCELRDAKDHCVQTVERYTRKRHEIH